MNNKKTENFNDKAEIDSDVHLNDFQPLSAEEIKLHIVGKTFLGSFPPFFKYIISVNADGSLEGKNNYQHYDTGNWIIDTKKNTLSVSWNLAGLVALVTFVWMTAWLKCLMLLQAS